MATFVKRNNRWTARIRKKGIDVSETFQTKGKAQAWANQTEADIESGKYKKQTDKTFADTIERYAVEISEKKRGARWELIRINVWKNLPFADQRLADVTTPMLAEWRDSRLKKVKTSTVNRELNLMASIFEQARTEWQLIESNPVRDVKRPPQPHHRERIYTDDEVKLICETLCFDGTDIRTKKQVIAVAFLFALETAMRRSEITGLTWDAIDLDKRVLLLPKTKNGDARKVPLSQKAIELLKFMQDFETPFPVGSDVMSVLFRRACIEAGIEDAHFHDARATALTRLSSKLEVLELARMVGHRDVRSLLIYYRETAESLALKLD